jgi:uncharacterized membrane protein
MYPEVEVDEPEEKIAVHGDRGIKVVRAVTVRKPADELYGFWRDVSNLPQIIHHPSAVSTTSADESHWKVSAPFGDVEWDAVIINDKPGEMIAWRSREGSDVDHAGSIRFKEAPGDEGVEVTVALEYDPPAGKLGAVVAKFTRDSASSQVYDALHRFKALMEAGEIPTTKGQPAGGPRRRKGKK